MSSNFFSLLYFHNSFFNSIREHQEAISSTPSHTTWETCCFELPLITRRKLTRQKQRALTSCSVKIKLGTDKQKIIFLETARFKGTVQRVRWHELLRCYCCCCHPPLRNRSAQRIFRIVRLMVGSLTCLQTSRQKIIRWSVSYADKSERRSHSSLNSVHWDLLEQALIAAVYRVMETMYCMHWTIIIIQLHFFRDLLENAFQ